MRNVPDRYGAIREQQVNAFVMGVDLYLRQRPEVLRADRARTCAILETSIMWCVCGQARTSPFPVDPSATAGAADTARAFVPPVWDPRDGS